MKGISFFNIRVISLIMLKKSWINLLTKLIWPRKDCRDFLLDGRDRLFMALTLSELMAHPSFDMTWPSSLPLSTAKIDFFGFKDIPYLLHLRKACSRCWA